MKNLLIGVFSHYAWDVVEPWVISAKKNIKNADIMLVVLNSNYETIDKITEQEVNVIILNSDSEKRIVYHKSNFAPHVERFIHIYHYLKEVSKDYKYVMTTDVRDVIFQSDPFDYMDEVFAGTNYKLICGSECLKYKDEPWGNENLFQTFGEYIHSQFKENEIFNVGVLGGYAEYMQDLCLNLFLSSVNRPIPIVDQAVFNVLVKLKPYSDVFKFAKLSDAFSINAGTTNDPTKYHTFKPLLLEEEAKLIGDVVYNSEDKPFVIVHQYDRVPEWNCVLEKYRLEV